mmetsp:Transcript_20543/g.36446  ORF Transcript_20543/g.36446 Transcript_20543/m.36446 type:complete len:202 (-) Transcript_20543:26-631(-)
MPFAASADSTMSSSAPVIALNVIRRLFRRRSLAESSSRPAPKSGVPGAKQCWPSSWPKSGVVGIAVSMEHPSLAATSGVLPNLGSPSSASSRAARRCSILSLRELGAPFSAFASAARRRSLQAARRRWIASFSSGVSVLDCSSARRLASASCFSPQSIPMGSTSPVHAGFGSDCAMLAVSSQVGRSTKLISGCARLGLLID